MNEKEIEAIQILNNFNKSGLCKELKAYNCCSIQSVLELLKELLGE